MAHRKSSSPTRRTTRKKPPGEPGFATLSVHGGQRPDPATGAVMPPIYQTSTYVQPGLGEGWPFNYARTVNPTRTALELSLAALEGGIEARCFASGMSAIHAVLGLLGTGDHVVASDNVYGGTYRLFEGVLRNVGLEVSWVDTSDPRATAAAVRDTTRMLWVETPTNPVLQLTDLRAVSRIAARRGLILAVDNTFMSPCLQRPLELGADIVVHSTTKYLNGHSDSVGGGVVLRREEHAERIGWLQNTVGAILSPMDSYLVLRGIKTLALRMERHDRSGRAVAAWLDAHPKVEHVFYPGLKSHPQHALARRQMKGFGGMVSFDVRTFARARKLMGRLSLCSLAESLGGVETLVSHPATMTHAAVPRRQRLRLGVGDGLVRISVGIEDVDDILADLEQALRGI